MGVLVAVVVCVALSARWLSQLAKHDDPEWRRRWRQIDRRKRRQIARAVRRGEAVPDPRDAALALELIASYERQPAAFDGETSRWRVAASITFDLLVIVGGLLVAIWAADPLHAAVVLLPALLIVAVAVVQRLTNSKDSAPVTRARAANEALIRAVAAEVATEDPTRRRGD